MRAFVAVEIPMTLREQIALLQENLQKTGADIQWVEPPNLHLTLKFLGESDERQLHALEEKLPPAVARTRPFSIRLEGVGAFPKIQFPRILWIGVAQGKEPLMKLAENIEKECRTLGFPSEERPFSPHLTIGRTRSSGHLSNLSNSLQQATFQAVQSFEVNEIILFQSVLLPEGPTHTAIKKIHFGHRTKKDESSRRRRTPPIDHPA